mmetsp:Transcript_18625/g.71857  ORF Transcript_18625/g.71857 Transcript_18625/m.71857 type:complete len:202 (-) Transcript_18625:1668-2273(-)
MKSDLPPACRRPPHDGDNVAICHVELLRVLGGMTADRLEILRSEVGSARASAEESSRSACARAAAASRPPLCRALSLSASRAEHWCAWGESPALLQLCRNSAPALHELREHCVQVHELCLEHWVVRGRRLCHPLEALLRPAVGCDLVVDLTQLLLQYLRLLLWLKLLLLLREAVRRRHSRASASCLPARADDPVHARRCSL